MSDILSDISLELDEIRTASLWKHERNIITAQSGHIKVAQNGENRPVLNLCANNYLGLADHPDLINAAHEALDTHGLGMASVRFICGTADLHLQLERDIAAYVGHEDAILFAACFDANGGIFEPLLGKNDAVISDQLNHASIIDGIRLCKAARYRYGNGDMADLQTKLELARAEGARRILVVSDGVFSMDGYFAKLAEIRTLADRYDAWLMVDDCHATGFVGPKGRGTPARAGIQVDIVTGTFGKALGGAAGGYIAADKPVIDLMRQRSRPYLFSNALPPAITAAAIKAIELAKAGDNLRERLRENASHFRTEMSAAGFSLLDGEHPIIPVMLGKAEVAQKMAARLFDEGVYVTGFFYPVVPDGQARIRTQMSAALSPKDIEQAVVAFKKAGRELSLI